jgi:hypothetical protein
MNPTASFVLALLALIASVASAVAAGWAVRQTWKYQRRARLHLEWPVNVSLAGGHSWHSASVTIVNHGNAPARDVTVLASTVEGGDLLTLREIPEGEAVTINVPVEFVRRLSAVPGMFERKGAAGTLRPVTVTLRWRKEATDDFRTRSESRDYSHR